MKIEIRKLPSGYWSVWIDGDWVEASLPSEESAREYVERMWKRENRTRRT